MGASSRIFSRYVGVIAIAAFALNTVGCNLFGKLDNPGELRDKYAQAIALANGGDCAGARDMLLSIQQPTNDDVVIALGWAYMCLGGATASVIASSLYKFTNGSTDYTSVGTLARNMLPWTSGKLNNITLAISTFGLVGDLSRRGLLTAIGDLALGANILSKQAVLHGDATVHAVNDIAPSTCANDSTSCAGSTQCTGPAGSGSGIGMNDTDTQGFINAISAAATALNTVNASDLKALAAAINSGITGAAGNNTARCFIFNQVIPNP